MRITKRDGKLENLSLDKVCYRLKKLATDKSLGKLSTIDTDLIAQKVISTIYDEVRSTELDEEAARIAISMTENLEFGKLASRIIISNIHKNTTECFSEVMEKLYNNIDSNDLPAPILADDIISIIRENKDQLNEAIDYSRDYLFDYFGFKTLEKSYLMKIKGKVIERPQHLYMRVAVQVHKNDIVNIIKTYNLISQHFFTFASPSMFNAGSRLQNLSSCFHEDTLVATLNKGSIKIKNVEIGDLVITHLGNVKKVQQLHKNLLNNRAFYDLDIYKTQNIKVTNNHKLWACTNELKPQWISVNDLKIGDYVSIPNGYKGFNKDYIIDLLDYKTLIENKGTKGTKGTTGIEFNVTNTDDSIILHSFYERQTKNQYTKDLENHDFFTTQKTIHNNINRFIKIDSNFARFLGIWYGDGCLITNKENKNKEKQIRGICITIDGKNQKLIDWCSEYMKTTFGNFNISKTGNTYNLNCISVYLGLVFEELFGKGFDKKKIFKDSWQWDISLINELVCGLLCSDGGMKKDGLIQLSMTNPLFMEELYYLLRNYGIDVSLGKDRIQKYNGKIYKTMSIPKRKEYIIALMKTYTDGRIEKALKMLDNTNQKTDTQIKKINDKIFLRLKSKTEITENLPEYVYTLGVEDDHSYNVGGIIAENCFLLGTHDSISGIYKTLADVAQISKVGGGIGIHINNIRSKGSVIRGTNGHSDGIIPMLKVYNETCKYVNQCILPHIPVFSKDGIKRMDEITTNDYLITHDGSYKKVNEIIVSKKKEEILEINIACGIEPLKCTKIHDIYTIKSNRSNGKARLLSQLERGIKKPEFIEAEKLTINDYVGFPIPKFEQDNQNWSLDKCRLYGIMLGDGNITFSKTGNRYQITLNNDTKLETKAFVIEQLLKNNIHYWIMNDYEICWAYNDLSIQKIGITNKMLYDKNHNKNCISDVLHLPKDKLAMIMKGLMESDGCKTDTGLFFTSTSKNLIQSLRYMCLRFGMLTSCQTVDKIGQVMSQNKKEKDIISRQICYYLRLPKIQLLKDYKIYDNFICSSNIKNYFEFNGILYCRIKSINKIQYEGEVYDFNMIDNHNYLTDMGLVHNSGKRKGSFAIYLSPEHPDIFEFLDLRKNQGSEDLRARDLFLAMWIPDLFMKQVESDSDWYLMDPDECPNLAETYGEKYEELYWSYVSQGKFRRKVKAQEIWMKILESQIETGTPYILYKDPANKMSNQKNIGTIKSSNLCSEILLYSDEKEYAVCFTGDTQILTNEGYRRIDECNNKQVLSYFNNDKEFKEKQQYITAKLIDNGIKDVYELECNGTKPIKATNEHLFAILDKRNFKNKTNTYIWKKLKDLKKDDKIILPKTQILPEYNIDIIRSVDENYLTIGWMVGDGWQCKTENMTNPVYGVCFGPNELYARDRVIKKLNEWKNNVECIKYGRNNITEFYTDKNNVFNWSSSKQNFIKYIKNEYGLMEKTAHYKCIPDKIKKSQPIHIASFLSGLFSADGSVYIKCSEKRNRFNINLSSSSKFLLDDVQQMLKCFGIESRTIFVDVKNRKDKQGKLSIENKESIINFNKHINFVLCKEKQQQLECGLKMFKKRNIFREYTKLKSITYIGKERVYDLNVPDTHNFIAEGFVVHNCNLMSFALPKYIKYENKVPVFDHQLLFETAKHVILPMNNIIDFNHYPIPETQKSNLAHRPIGCGIQGLSDTYIKMRLPFDSEEAKKLNKEISETIYFGLLTGSMELAKKDGAYSTFKGSPISEGKFQFDLQAEFNGIDLKDYLSGRWDWESLRTQIKEHGIRNSTVTTCMPTASSAQIMGNTESFEQFDSCIFKRRVLAGEYTVANKHLVEDLTNLGLWNKEMKDQIIAHNGSIQEIETIPENIRELYKTVWEIKMKDFIDQSAQRSAFICMTQSLNLFSASPTIKKLTNMHFYAWKAGLKTGMYYLRSKSSSSAAKFTIDPALEKKIKEKQKKGKSLTKKETQAAEILACSIENKEQCDLCTS